MANKTGWAATLKARWQDLLVEYGIFAIATILSLKLINFLVFVALLEQGTEPEALLVSLGFSADLAETLGTGGTWGLAYGITELFKLPRIALGIALTPLVARAWYRVTGKAPPQAAVETAPETTQEAQASEEAQTEG